MPRKAKTTEPEAASAKKQPHGAKTAAIKQALIANPTKQPKEIAELLKQQGFETTPKYVSVMKAELRGQKKAKAVPATAAPVTGVPVVPKDAVSIGLLQKAKKLAAQFSNIKEAKAAIDALAQILD